VQIGIAPQAEVAALDMRAAERVGVALRPEVCGDERLTGLVRHARVDARRGLGDGPAEADDALPAELRIYPDELHLGPLVAVGSGRGVHEPPRGVGSPDVCDPRLRPHGISLPSRPARNGRSVAAVGCPGGPSQCAISFATRRSTPYFWRSFGFSILPVGLRGTSSKM